MGMIGSLPERNLGAIWKNIVTDYDVTPGGSGTSIGDLPATCQRSSSDRFGGWAGGKFAGTRWAPDQSWVMKSRFIVALSRVCPQMCPQGQIWGFQKKLGCRLRA